MSIAGFSKGFDRTFGREGRLKYTSPERAAATNDRGGETIGGYARNRRPDFAGWPIVDQLRADADLDRVLADPACPEHRRLMDLVREDYHQNYWSRLGLDYVPEPLSYALFDVAVNQGPGVMARTLQAWLNGLNREGRDYADVTEDGDLGPATRAALQGYVAKRGEEGVRVLLAGIVGERAVNYRLLARAHQDQEGNLYGWMLGRVLADADLLQGA